jgi:DNA-binding CsgD family transcriptional regulator
MKLDAIAAIEAAYAPAASCEAWARGILTALAPLDQGHGLYALTLDASDPERIVATVASMFRPDPEFLRHGLEANAQPDSDHMRALYWRSPPVELASRRVRQLAGRPPGSVQAAMRAVTDMLGVFAIDSDDRGLFVGAPWPTGRAPGPRTIHLLTRVAAHVTSAWRLRKLAGDDLASGPAGDRATEAVLDPGGRLRDASGDARDALERDRLARAVRRMDRARTRARRADPVEAAELWRALVSGRWTLVDRFDADGRRFVLARRNEPHVYDPKALSRTEGQVAAFAIQGHANKHIAYLLGLAPSTVAAHLASACRKLGVRTQSELTTTFGGARL